MSALPATRRALLCEALTDDLSGLGVATLPLAPPGPGEVVVRVRAAALNYPDYLMTQGRYQHRPEPPFVPGMEAAGEVLACGTGVDTCKPGDAVVVHVRDGAFADHLVVPAREVRARPAGLDWAQAAAHHAAAVTAYVALVRRADARAGDTLLVHGASGGVGMAAVQLGRHLGMRVIATGTSEDKLAVVRAQGAGDSIVTANWFLRTFVIGGILKLAFRDHDVQERINANYAKAGFNVVAERHLGLSHNFSFSEVTEEEIIAMTREVAKAKPQAIIPLCTNLRSAPLVEALEKETGIPIYDSISTAVWKCLKLSGVDPKRVQGWGRLFREVA
jgi:NADPH:quinone reductase-like Zn-dependent oxidoreductase